MLRKLDRIAVVIVSATVGLKAIIPAGFRRLLCGRIGAARIVGGGCIAPAVANIDTARVGVMTALLMGIVLIGWIAEELLFLTQTTIMTWLIVGSGVLLVVLSVPGALPELNRSIARRGGAKRRDRTVTVRLPGTLR